MGAEYECRFSGSGDSACAISMAFDKDISSWDVSRVTTFYGMFAYGTFNHDISSWNLASAGDMAMMFKDNLQFNQNLASWKFPVASNLYAM